MFGNLTIIVNGLIIALEVKTICNFICIFYIFLRGFIRLIFFLMFSSGSFILFSIFLSIEYYYNERSLTNFASTARFFYSSEGEVLVGLIICWIFGCIAIICLILDANLFVFHLWLIKHNITTYEFIIMNREKKKLNS